MPVHRLAVTAATTLSVFLLAAPGALAAVKTSTAPGAEVECNDDESTKTHNIFDCYVSDTKSDRQPAGVVLYKVHPGGEEEFVGEKTNSNGYLTHTNVRLKWRHGEKLEFRAVGHPGGLIQYGETKQLKGKG